MSLISLLHLLTTPSPVSSFPLLPFPFPVPFSLSLSPSQLPCPLLPFPVPLSSSSIILARIRPNANALRANKVLARQLARAPSSAYAITALLTTSILLQPSPLTRSHTHVCNYSAGELVLNRVKGSFHVCSVALKNVIKSSQGNQDVFGRPFFATEGTSGAVLPTDR